MVVEDGTRFAGRINQIVARMLRNAAELLFEMRSAPDEIERPLATVDIGGVNDCAGLFVFTAGVKAKDGEGELVFLF